MNKITGSIKVTTTLPLLLSFFLLTACGQATGLDRPIDGSSVDAYNQTVSQLRNELTAAEFQEFQRAVNYLQIKGTEFADISAFYESLDGTTISQVIERANAARNTE